MCMQYNDVEILMNEIMILINSANKNGISIIKVPNDKYDCISYSLLNLDYIVQHITEDDKEIMVIAW